MIKTGALLVLMLFFSAITVSEGSVYQKHGISFEVPANWTIVKDHLWDNDTQIILSDNVSAIRIDLIKTSDKEINKMVADSVARKKSPGSNGLLGSQVDANTSWKLLYSLDPWLVADGVNEYYIGNVIHPTSQIAMSGSGTTIKPDGVADAGVATNYGYGSDPDPVEWSIGWTKPEYNGQIMGVHALFSGNYTQQPLGWNGASQKYSIAKPLWTVLSTLTTGSKPKSSSLVGMV